MLPGMTLLDWFAGMVLSGGRAQSAVEAYRMADDMMAERARRTQEMSQPLHTYPCAECGLKKTGLPIRLSVGNGRTYDLCSVTCYEALKARQHRLETDARYGANPESLNASVLAGFKV
jgi:hypothetical protein